MIDEFYRLFRGLRNYGNPLSLAWQRSRKSPTIEITDRRTGLTFRCRRGGDNMLAETFHAHIYDVPFAPLRAGDVVLDIGANHGFYACWAARQGATVHAYEPDPQTYDLLVENVHRNGLDEQIRTYKCAVGAEAGSTQMFCSAELGGGMSTIIPAFAVKSGINVISQANVKVITLADALSNTRASRVRVCKLDCEGAEFFILRAMEPSLIECFDSFALEYHPQAYKMADLIDLMLTWENFHLSRAVSRDVDLENANLMAVHTDLMRQWSDAGNSTRRRGRKLVQT